MSLQLDISHINKHFTLELKCQFPALGISGIFGHSGTGKTTLLRCIAGLEQNVSGTINFHGRQWLNNPISHRLGRNNKTQFIKTEDRRVGMVFQDSRLFPHLSVKQNLQLAQRQVVSPKLSIDKLSDDFSISQLLAKSASQLSAGQQQRVAIVRSLLAEPELLLLDEPLSALDMTAKKRLMLKLKQHSSEYNLPMLYISHSAREIAYLCDKLLILEHGRKIAFDQAKPLLKQHGFLGQHGHITDVDIASNRITIELSPQDCHNLSQQGDVYITKQIK